MPDHKHCSNINFIINFLDKGRFYMLLILCIIYRVHLLEETIREIDSRAQEQLSEEQKKYKELIVRTQKVYIPPTIAYA